MLSSGTCWVPWEIGATREGSDAYVPCCFHAVMCSEDKSQPKPTCALKHLRHPTSPSAAVLRRLEVMLFLCWPLPSSPCVNLFFRPCRSLLKANRERKWWKKMICSRSTGTGHVTVGCPCQVSTRWGLMSSRMFLVCSCPRELLHGKLQFPTGGGKGPGLSGCSPGALG